MAATRFAVVVDLVTAGQQGDALGSDEQDTVVFSWLVVDLANNKVGGPTPLRPRAPRNLASRA